jgi:hypothetical protein
MFMKVKSEQSKRKTFTETHHKVLVTIRISLCASFNFVHIQETGLWRFSYEQGITV